MHLRYLSLLALTTYAAAQNQGLIETLASNSNLSQLVGLVNSTGLASVLSGASNVTVLAPSNDAIAALLNSSQAEQLRSDPGLVSAVLQYHVLNGTYRANEITNMSTFVPTMLNNASYANVTDGQRVQAIMQEDSVRFFSGLLMNSTVTQPDIPFNGGIAHIIDTVLTLPMTVLDTLVPAGLTSLYGALNTTNLLDPVSALTDVTIFAPNNAAFRAIGSALPNLTTEEVTSILGYHVVNGTVGYSSGLQNNTKLTTFSGEEVTIILGQNGSVFVNDAKVVTPDVLVANGVVHVIDQVLNPQNTTATPNPTATAGSPGFSDASSATDDPFTSGVASATSTLPSGGATGTGTSTAGMPMKTAGVGAAALFGAGAVFWGV